MSGLDRAFVVGTDKRWQPDYPYEPWREFEIWNMYNPFPNKNRPPLSWWMTFWEECLKISDAIESMETTMCYYTPNIPEVGKQRIFEYARELRRVWCKGFDITWRPR